MILIFGGTGEGRQVVAVCDQAAKPYYYATKGNLQEVSCLHGISLTGELDEEKMIRFCEQHNIRLIIDAAHPFAGNLHAHVAAASAKTGIPVIRYERSYPERDPNLSWFDTYDEALAYLETHRIENLLALTGAHTISVLKPFWLRHACWFRILDRDESRQIAKEAGFPPNRILFFGQNETEKALFERLKPQAIITKESGDSGGFNEKVKAARELDIPVLVVKRPALPASFIPVYGQNGLRLEIDKLLPGFFELRTGYTTGTCATAAAKAALIALLTGETHPEVYITLPCGEKFRVPIAWTKIDGNEASCAVVKDAGDDPDITDGLEIISSVKLNSQTFGVRFLQGKGVGTVTLPGLGLEIGGPAINATPREMMTRETLDVLHTCRNKLLHQDMGVDITVSVTGGEEIAKKTFNPKLGIEGGISIIGTSGIVKPYSTEAFLDAIRREMQVAKALGCEHIVINSGAKSARHIQRLYPDYPPQAFIHYGNFIGETIRIASELCFRRVTLGVMIGKAVKLAEGALETHSKNTAMNKSFLAKTAKEAGCNEKTITAIQQISLARQLWKVVPEQESAFFNLLVAKCRKVCIPLFPQGELTVLLIDEDGGFGKR